MRARRKDEVSLPSPMKLLLSDTEVAAVLGIGVSTVWKKTNTPDSGFPQPFYITERARRGISYAFQQPVRVKGLSHEAQTDAC